MMKTYVMKTLLMLMYNLLEYGSNYSDTTGMVLFQILLTLILRTLMILNLSCGRLNE